MTDRELVAAIGALIGPGVIAIVQRPLWSARRRAVVAFIIMLAWTTLVFFFTGGEPPAVTDWRAWLRLLFISIVGTFTSYQGLWKQLGWAQWIEARTAPSMTVSERAGVKALDDEVDRKQSPPHIPIR